MPRLTIATLVLITLLATAAQARDAVLHWDNGQFDKMERVNNASHFVEFATDPSWKHSFTDSLEIYCQSYGDVSGLRGAVIIWGPQTDETAKIEDHPDSMVVWGRSYFEMDDLPKKAAWITLPLETVELPPKFGVSFYAYSNDERGAEVGLCTPDGGGSHSASEQLGTKDAARYFKHRTDGREWMMRLKVRETLAATSAVRTADISGSGYHYFDDGSADGFVTTQKFGPAVKFSNSGKKKITGIYVYGKLAGDWFGTSRMAGVWVLTPEFKIIKKLDLHYSVYTTDPSWNYVSLNDTEVPAEYYVVVEPAARPEVQFLVGYDGSSSNHSSSFATPGAPKEWMTDAPQDSTNWMIRVEYK